MQVLAERHGVALRPHAKAPRRTDIALRQIALGAVGICCQKVSEAVPFVQAGVRDIPIRNEIVGAHRMELLAQLPRRATTPVCIAPPFPVQDMSDGMAGGGVEWGLRV